MKTKFAIAMFIVSFVLALGFAQAEEENVQPQAYQAEPAVLIVMKPGDTFWGICRKIELEGNLPSRISNAGVCGQMVAENHTKLSKDAAMKAAEKIPAGTAVLFPFKVAEAIASTEVIQVQDEVIAEKDQEISTLDRRNGELKSAFDSVSDELKRKAADFKAEVDRISGLMAKANQRINDITAERDGLKKNLDRLAALAVASLNEANQTKIVLEEELANMRDLQTYLSLGSVGLLVCAMLLSLRKHRQTEMYKDIVVAYQIKQPESDRELAKFKSQPRECLLPEFHEQGGRKFQVWVKDTTPGAEDIYRLPKNLRNYLNTQNSGGAAKFIEPTELADPALN